LQERYKIAASAAQLALAICFMLNHVQMRLPAARSQTKSSCSLLIDIMMVLIIILKEIEVEILKKLRTASLNS